GLSRGFQPVLRFHQLDFYQTYRCSYFASRAPGRLGLGRDNPLSFTKVYLDNSDAISDSESSASNARASRRSAVSHPSVNEPNTSASAWRPSAGRLRSRRRRARLTAARNSKDFAPCRRATSRARRKQASALSRANTRGSGSLSRARPGSAQDVLSVP